MESSSFIFFALLLDTMHNPYELPPNLVFYRLFGRTPEWDSKNQRNWQSFTTNKVTGERLFGIITRNLRRVKSDIYMRYTRLRMSGGQAISRLRGKG